jgi:formate dehydrogenase gamma subunit
VAQTCGACHTQIRDKYLESIHGQATKEGLQDAPVCTDCHGEHNILAPSNPMSPVNPARLSTMTCGRCHGNILLTARYHLPANRMVTFEASYHGLALQEGRETVANCASCHGVHGILPSSDPRSRINPANLARTCGQCHPSAGKTFAIGPIHVLPSSLAESPVVRWVRISYLILIPLTLGLMFFHNAVDFIAKVVRNVPRRESRETVPRMSLHFRITHWLVMISFPTLVITGFALKYPSAWWARPILIWERKSGFDIRGTTHRVAGVVLIASLLYHFVHLATSRQARAALRQMRPGIQDLRDAAAMIRYNLGFTSERPQLGKFSYGEKAEYLAFIWGTVVMAISGLLLWFINFTLRYFPKWVADAATVLHFYEAILATFSILVWHFYMTIFDPEIYPMDRSWLTGRASAEHLQHTRPAYYAALRRKFAMDQDPPAP